MSNTQQEDGCMGCNKVEALQIQTSNEAYSQSSEDENEEGEDSVMSPICKPYDPDKVREAIVYMIIVDGLPFKFVEGEGFKGFMNEICPGFKIPSRWAVARDCYQLYVNERTKLKSFMDTNCERVCISTDTWTSLQEIDYMCITAHFIDNEWNLQKKVLNFVPVPSHRGEEIGEALESCLLDWGLKSVFTITVDNASSNDTAVEFLTKKMLDWGSGIANCKYLHMRCIAHVINLVVSDALEDISPSVERVREAVRYIMSSPDRFDKFKECAELEGIKSENSLRLDVPTRWNSTYAMLTIAEKFQRAFEKYDELDSSYRADLGDDGVPTLLDWTYVRRYAELLKVFGEFTLRISSSECNTSSSFFTEVCELPYFLNEWEASEDCETKSLVKSTKEKFDKYWGDSENMNKIIFWTSVFDPREKFECLEYLLVGEIYGTENGAKIFQCVKNEFFELFDEYEKKYQSDASPRGTIDCEMVDKRPGWLLRDRFKKQKMESRIARNKKNELEVYLSEDTIVDEEDIDLLKWWKENSERFPILSRMARDILAVPISRVASESAFITADGRVLDEFRSSLTPTILEALICGQDWLRGSVSPAFFEEQSDDLEDFEKELSNLGIGGALSDTDA